MMRDPIARRTGTALIEWCEMLRTKGLKPAFKNGDSTYREPAQCQKLEM